jgi:hypothetical protein
MNGFTNQQIIGGLVTVLIASYAAFFAWVVTSIRELHSRIVRLDEKFTRNAALQPVTSRKAAGDFPPLASGQKIRRQTWQLFRCPNFRTIMPTW